MCVCATGSVYGYDAFDFEMLQIKARANALMWLCCVCCVHVCCCRFIIRHKRNGTCVFLKWKYSHTRSPTERETTSTKALSHIG